MPALDFRYEIYAENIKETGNWKISIAMNIYIYIYIFIATYICCLLTYVNVGCAMRSSLKNELNAASILSHRATERRQHVDSRIVFYCNILLMKPRCIDMEVKPMKKKNWCDVTERYSWSWLLRTFLKLSLKMPSIFCEFGCCNRKLCVNKPISFFSYNTGPNVNKKMTHQQQK